MAKNINLPDGSTGLVIASIDKDGNLILLSNNDPAVNVLAEILEATGQKHDRYITGITEVWPSDDTFAVTFTQLEDVRRYRWRFNTTSGTITHVKTVEDSVNEAQAEVWLTDATASGSIDVENRRLETTGVWSEWIELSKAGGDLSLSRLDFLAAGTSPVVSINVEAE